VSTEEQEKEIVGVLKKHQRRRNSSECKKRLRFADEPLSSCSTYSSSTLLPSTSLPEGSTTRRRNFTINNDDMKDVFDEREKAHDLYSEIIGSGVLKPLQSDMDYDSNTLRIKYPTIPKSNSFKSITKYQFDPNASISTLS
jgi:hypothetical protein